MGESVPSADQRLRRELEAALPGLLRLAHRLTPPGFDEQDLVQDVLERAWRSRDAFRRASSTATWLHRILVNRANDLHRRTRSMPAEQLAAEPPEIEVDDPADVLERAEDAQRLRAALSRLPPLERTLLVLHDGEGWRAAELAELCALSQAAVHKRVQRARLRLAAELCKRRVPSRPIAPECLRARASAGAYLEGELSGAERERVEHHLRGCERCPPVMQALVGLRAVLRDSGHPAPAELRGAIAAAVDHRL
jgi:RNA polymerase sigma factor (sigma-70 family)